MELKKLAPWNWFRHEQESGTHPMTFGNFTSDPFTTMREEMNRMMSELTGEKFPTTRTNTNWDFRPAVDIKDAGTEYRISVEVPGVDKDDIKVEIHDGLMLISGEKRHEAREEKKNFYRVESSYGCFSRALNLPADADEERVNANFKNGILTLDIAKHSKTETAGARQINIK